MTPNQKPSEALAVLATCDAASVGAGTVTSGWVSASTCAAFLVLLATGVLGASATVDAKLQQAQDSSGTGAKDISGKAIAQIVKASGDNKQALINLRAEELDVNNGYSYFRLSITVGTAASIVGAAILGVFPDYAPASAFNQAAVAQIVA